MARRKPKVGFGPADKYAHASERIVEYSYADGTSKVPGGLISIAWAEPDDGPGRLRVSLYRHNDVQILVSPGENQPASEQLFTGAEIDAAIGRALAQMQLDDQFGGEFNNDLLNVAFAAVNWQLTHPHGTLDEAIEDNWADSDRPSEFATAAAWVRSWWGCWS